MSIVSIVTQFALKYIKSSRQIYIIATQSFTLPYILWTTNAMANTAQGIVCLLSTPTHNISSRALPYGFATPYGAYVTNVAQCVIFLHCSHDVYSTH